MDGFQLLDAVVAEANWESLSPLADAIPASGAFGTGAGGDLDEHVPLQRRLLDLLGRRS
jgi:hypothetical protein